MPRRLATLRSLRPSLNSCAVCGHRGAITVERVLDDQLIQQWKLDIQEAKLIDEREGLRCFFCRSSGRARHLASCILDVLRERGRSYRCLDDAVGDGLGGLAVAEINSCAQLHARLRRLPRLAYSEYGSTDSTVPHQDLELLTYPSDSFDMVLTSDTLEHVPDVWTALQETKRVLAHGGAHVFTVPIVWSRKTVARAVRTPDGIDQRLPPSYHGPKGKCEPDRLVFNEFGSDFPALAAQNGLPLEVRTCPGNPLNAVFVLRKAVE